MPSTLAANALTTYDAVRSALGLASVEGDPRRVELERLINMASASLEELAHREFHRGAAVVENHRAEGGQYLYLRRRPVVSVTSVQHLDPEDGTVDETIASASYWADLESGCLFRADGWPDDRLAAGVTGDPVGTAPRTIRVTYTGGWITPSQAIPAENTGGTSLGTRDLPYDVEDAVIRCVVSAASRYGQDETVGFANNVNVSRSWSGSAQKHLEQVARRYFRGK